MAVIENSISPTSESYQANRAGMLAQIARVGDEASAREVIAAARKAHADARHHCSAFVVSVEDAQPVERSSDDGEPAGTGGMPILAALHGSGLVDVVCVVTRWFGGVKLGAGPLARAYGDAAGAALVAAYWFIIDQTARPAIPAVEWIGAGELLVALGTITAVGIALAIVPTLLATRKYLRI